MSAAQSIVKGLDGERDDLPDLSEDISVTATPTNRTATFAPVIDPTLETGVQTPVAASCAWLQR